MIISGYIGGIIMADAFSVYFNDFTKSYQNTSFISLLFIIYFYFYLEENFSKLKSQSELLFLRSSFPHCLFYFIKFFFINKIKIKSINYNK